MNVDNKGEGRYILRIPEENIDFELTGLISGISTWLYVSKLWFSIYRPTEEEHKRRIQTWLTDLITMKLE